MNTSKKIHLRIFMGQFVYVIFFTPQKKIRMLHKSKRKSVEKKIGFGNNDEKKNMPRLIDKIRQSYKSLKQVEVVSNIILYARYMLTQQRIKMTTLPPKQKKVTIVDIYVRRFNCCFLFPLVRFALIIYYEQEKHDDDTRRQIRKKSIKKIERSCRNRLGC